MFFRLSDRQVNILLFVCLSLLWGFTWFCGKYQINNTLIPEFAVFYRFIISSLFILGFCLLNKYPLKPTKHELKVFAFYGFFSSCLNFILFYYAALYLVTGFSAIIFSFSIIFNLFVGRIFFNKKDKIGIITLLSIITGILSLSLIIAPKIQYFQIDSSFISGIFLAFLATISFCIGSVFYENQKHINLKTPVAFFYFNIIGSFWCFLMGIIHSLMDNKPIILLPDLNIQFIWSFLYLAIPSTAIGYLCFFALIKRIGSVKASYTTLISPVIAILVSSILEDYKFTTLTFLGLILLSISKFIMLKPKKAPIA